MKLLLTSSGIGVKDEITKFIPKPYSDIRVAYIITASKKEDNTSYLDAETELLNSLGCTVEPMTFEDCNKEQSHNLLKDKNLIYVQGGNTFYLLKVLKESGADNIIVDMVKNGTPYIGVSAGSYIACPTIEMASWKHQDRNTCGLKDLTALNLVPFLMSVHYVGDYKDILKREIAKTKYDVKILNDEQALLITDNNVELVGDTTEIIL